MTTDQTEFVEWAAAVSVGGHYANGQWSRRAVLTALAGAADPAGIAYKIGQDEIADAANLTRRQAKRILASLRADGLIAVAGTNPNSYLLLASDAAKYAAGRGVNHSIAAPRATVEFWGLDMDRYPYATGPDPAEFVPTWGNMSPSDAGQNVPKAGKMSQDGGEKQTAPARPPVPPPPYNDPDLNLDPDQKREEGDQERPREIRTEPNPDPETEENEMREDSPGTYKDLATRPAIMAIEAATGRHPPPLAYPILIQRLGDNPAVGPLARAVALWAMAGNKPENLNGICDWYDRILADPDWSPTDRFNRENDADAANAAEAAWSAAIDHVRHDKIPKDPRLLAAIRAPTVGWSAIRTMDATGPGYAALRRRFLDAWSALGSASNDN